MRRSLGHQILRNLNVDSFQICKLLFFPFLAEADLSAQDLVDFSPVYKCLHIYTVLGEREEFEKYYRKQRRQQATLTLQPPSNMHESIGKTIF